jgi:hypothetical protein
MKRTNWIRVPLLYAAIAATLGGAAAMPAHAATAAAPTEWDGLVRRPTRGLDAVYVRPDVTFNAYQAVRLLPIEVEFDRNWRPNSNARSTTRRLNDADVQRIRDNLAAGFREVLTERLERGGYKVVDTNGDDVLAVKAGLINVFINAPDPMSAGRTRSYVVDAGRMTLVMQLHDSVTAQLLARAVDTQRGSRNGSMQWASSATNSAEARRAFGRWADQLVRALDTVNGKATPR